METDNPMRGVTFVHVDTLARIEQRLDTLQDMVGGIDPRPAPGRDGTYVEPGPDAERQFFTPQELMKRWDCGKTKVYEIPEDELPALKLGALKRYFWSYVWAYEGRISRGEADRIYREHAVQKA